MHNNKALNYSSPQKALRCWKLGRSFQNTIKISLAC